MYPMMQHFIMGIPITLSQFAFNHWLCNYGIFPVALWEDFRIVLLWCKLTTSQSLSLSVNVLKMWNFQRLTFLTKSPTGFLL